MLQSPDKVPRPWRMQPTRVPGTGCPMGGAGGGAILPGPEKNWARQGTSAQYRKTIKKAGRILKQAVEALDTRRYRASEALFDEGIALLENPPSRLWC